MEREENTNLWANRLQEIPLPESEQAWMAMEKLLDKELPPVNRIPRNYRVLGMVAPVLALIIGYVLVHGRHQTAGSAQGKQARPKPPVLESVRAAKRQDAEQKNQPFHKGSVAPDRESIRSSSGSIRPVDRRDQESAQTSPRGSRPDDRGDQQKQEERERRDPEHRRNGTIRWQKNALRDTISSTARQSRVPALPGPGSIKPLDIAPLGAKRAGAIVDIPLAREHKAIALTPVQKIKKELVWEKKGLRLGVGFVQPLITGVIQLTGNPYNGLNPLWKNYFPIVEADYFFNERSYLTVEAMFHQPQDTHENLRFMYPVYNPYLGYVNPDGLYSIFRLFYFKLPVTMNSRLSRHWTM